MCSAECAAIALGLSGISCMEATLRFARPKMYVEGTLGPPGISGMNAPLANVSGLQYLG
jgi:hypothetical protein